MRADVHSADAVADGKEGGDGVGGGVTGNVKPGNNLLMAISRGPR